MKTKKKIRLTESDLENLINESVRSVLNEGMNKKRLSEFEQELQRKHPIKRLAILAGRYYFCIVIQKTRL